MLWFYTQCLLPVLNVLYILLDWVLGWTTYLSPMVALIIAGAITGVAVNLFQKYVGNQKLLGQCKDDLKKIKELLQAANATKDTEKAARLRSLTSKVSAKYGWGSLKPALWSVPPLCVLAMWTGSRLSFMPVRPGDEIAVVANFEDGAAGFAHIVPNKGLVPVGPPIQVVAVPQPMSSPAVTAIRATEIPAAESKKTEGKTADTKAADTKVADTKAADTKATETQADESASGPQAHWLVKAACEGDFPLTVRYNDANYQVAVSVRARGGRAVESPQVFNVETPTHDNLQAVELKLSDSVPAAWWNLRMKWLGLYLVVAMAFGFALRPMMKIQ